ncbi:hypothetical protein [Aureimonas sp. AU22]|uniref:hypothetical protein n=1 Tax=Aureimonas sp. AU22 TaxID=1638162 RepID=UPI0007858476|nr:hypothetical protein [Aureimonas sp. AU22]
MRTVRLHLVAVLLALIGFATSMPQLPVRHHGHALRSPAQIQLDDDDDDRDDDAALLEEDPDGGAASGERRRRT